MSVVAPTEHPETLRAAFGNGYAKLFGQQWPVWVGGVLFGMLNVLLFAYERPWSAADGVRNWGDWMFNTLGVTKSTIISPHLYSTSVLNLGIIGGALAAALLARQFQIRMAPPWELFKGLIGGGLMGVGASLAFGCNIGGFFSAMSALSMAGVAMMAGLIAGVFVGLKLLVWEVSYISVPGWASRTTASKQGSSRVWKNIQPFAGFGVLIVGLSSGLRLRRFRLFDPRRLSAVRDRHRLDHAANPLLLRALLPGAVHDWRRRHGQGGRPCHHHQRHRLHHSQVDGSAGLGSIRLVRILDGKPSRRLHLRRRHVHERRLRDGLAVARR